MGFDTAACHARAIALRAILALVSSFAIFTGWCADPDASKLETSKNTEQAYKAAEIAYNAQPTNPVAAWQFARSCFDLADLAAKNSERADLAEKGIKAAQQAIKQDPKSAAAHYYLGMDLGQLARTKSLGALRLVGQMEREFKTARELDEHFDHAGPDRNLGMLYRDAPVLTSVGSRTKARQHLQRAVELAPDFPDNRLSLLEAYLKYGEKGNALTQLNALDKLWPEARKSFAGSAWTASWLDWEDRLKACRAKLAPSTVGSR